MTDLADLAFTAPEEGHLNDFNQMLEKIADDRLRGQVKDSLSRLMAPDARRTWTAGSPDQQVWSSLVQSSAAGMGDGYKMRLTEYLVRIACKPRWSNGAVATGIAKRGLGVEFKGDLIALYDRLKADDCPASKTMSRRTLRALSTQVDITRGN